MRNQSKFAGLCFDIETAKTIFFIIIGFAAMLTSPLAAQPQKGAEESKFPQPQALQEIVACQSISDDIERLKCYDSSVTQFTSAAESGEVIVAEKKVVDEARKEVFGLSVSDNPIFGNKDDDGVKSIESTIASARKQRNGKWIIRLENGASWRQTSTRSLSRDPKPGQKIIIERALLGSFKARIEGRRAFKVLRVR